MIVRDLFKEDINRNINGVIQVEQSDENIIEQEVREYVITRELRKHFSVFFSQYKESFDGPTSDIGVWISGFFGSGKSHFLKMLSYILENRTINGQSTVERFREKFSDDPATFMNVDASTKGETEVILADIANVAIHGKVRIEYIVLAAFAKMFYCHLGYYGDNLKVVQLERHLEEQGKLEDFKKQFLQLKGSTWEAQRKNFDFCGSTIRPLLVSVLEMTEAEAENWFNTKDVNISIDQFVKDVKAYVDTKPQNYRLLFMVDEVGQFVGADTTRLLDLQSIVESLGSVCKGKVWVICTGQEAIDDVIRVRNNEFSRIQARFKIRLSLSSSSVDEVIQKRILQKTDAASEELERIYNESDGSLRNIFTFKNARTAIQGFNGPRDFIDDFPFVSYQFDILQKVYTEVRKHGNAMLHMASGERSMLSGFQESLKLIQLGDIYTLAPFYRFYDTLAASLDSSITQVFFKCNKAAEAHQGIKPEDVDVLKLLYLVRYIDDIPSNIDNIVILMTDSIKIDKIKLKKQVLESLERLEKEGYIRKIDECYQFLTNEEQDIQREIKNVPVDHSKVINRIHEILFDDIYQHSRFRYEPYDFDFSKYIDGYQFGNGTYPIALEFYTDANEEAAFSGIQLAANSSKKVLVVLAREPYYQLLEKILKVRLYGKTKNINQLSATAQTIYQSHQNQATKEEHQAKEMLENAILNGTFYIDGQVATPQGSTAKAKLDNALRILVERVYTNLGDIEKHFTKDSEIKEILNEQTLFGAGTEPNPKATKAIEDYLLMLQHNYKAATMEDVQKHFAAVPYGWTDIDIAAAVAFLLYQQRITVKYAGCLLKVTDSDILDKLRQKNLIAGVKLAIRESISNAKIIKVKGILRNYFGAMSIPDDEDGLIQRIIEWFEKDECFYKDLDARYANHRPYPDRNRIQNILSIIGKILSNKGDPISLIDEIIASENNLGDAKEDAENIVGFFENQVGIFDCAVDLTRDLVDEEIYFESNSAGKDALDQIKDILYGDHKFDYRKIPELNTLMDTVNTVFERMLLLKREEVSALADKCMDEIRAAAGNNTDSGVSGLVYGAGDYFKERKNELAAKKKVTVLESMKNLLTAKKDEYISKIKEEKSKTETSNQEDPPVQKQDKTISVEISSLFTPRNLGSKEDAIGYIEQVKLQLLSYFDDYGEVCLKVRVES